MSAHRFIGVLLALLSSVASSRMLAQSLADVARQEEERRKSVAAPTKVYTNKDLGAAAAPTPAAAATKDAKDPKESKDSKDGKDAKDDKDAAGSKDAGDQDKSKQPKDKAYWSSRLKALQDQLDRDSGYSVALQTRINSLTTDFVNRDDPAQKAVIERDRQKALAELERLKKAVIDDKKAIADFEEEARRAGVPPGWLR